MTDLEVQAFVTRFAAAWAARDGEALLALWNPDGVPLSPLYAWPVAGKELGKVTELVRENAPDHVWRYGSPASCPQPSMAGADHCARMSGRACTRGDRHDRRQPARQHRQIL